MSNMVNINSMVFMPAFELREVLREIVVEELKKVPYYGLGNTSDEIKTLEEAAEYCDVCTRTLTERVKQGKLKSGGTGRKYLFMKSELDAFIFKTKKS